MVQWISQEYYQLLNPLFLGDSLHTRDLPQLIRTSGTSWEFLSQYFRRCVQECEQKQYRYEAVVFGIVTELAVQLARILRTEQVSIPVGFQDYSTFYRAFKAEFGQSPTQFRKELR